MKLSILIVNWNTKEHLHKCLLSIEKHLSDTTHEITVVDNASEDGSADLVREKHPEVSLIRNNENRGFAAACNQAAKNANGEFLLLLNPDVVLESGAVHELLSFLEPRPAAAAAPLLKLPDGRLQLGPGGYKPTVRTAFNHYFLLSRICSTKFPGIWLQPGNSTQPIQVDWLSGACLLLRRSHFESVEGFDEKYFMYAEDMDLCDRLSEKGISYFLLPARVSHDFGAAFRLAGSPEYCMDALFNYFLKHNGVSDARKALHYAWLGLSFRALILRIAGAAFRNKEMILRSNILTSHAVKAHKLSKSASIRNV